MRDEAGEDGLDFLYWFMKSSKTSKNAIILCIIWVSEELASSFRSRLEGAETPPSIVTIDERR
jgi:hypothetical protein